MMRTTPWTVLLVALVAVTHANASKLSGNLRAKEFTSNEPIDKFHLGRNIPGGGAAIRGSTGMAAKGLSPTMKEKKLRDGRHEPKDDVGVMQLLDSSEQKKKKKVLDDEEQRELNNDNKETKTTNQYQHAGRGFGGKLEAKELKHNLRYADAMNHHMNTEGIDDPATHTGKHHSRHPGHVKNLLHGIQDKVPVDAAGAPAATKKKKVEGSDDVRKLHGHKKPNNFLH